MKIRSITEVIDAMIEAAPATETGLIAALEARKQSAKYSAPEAQGVEWRRLADVLREHMGPAEHLVELWQNRIVQIWTGAEGPKPTIDLEAGAL